MPQDAAQTILSPLQVDNTVKANAWEAYNSAKNETDLQVKLMGMKDLPDSAKADLWEAKKSASGMSKEQQGMALLPNPVDQARQQLQNIPQYTSPTDKLRAEVAYAQSTPPSGLSQLVSRNPNDPRTRYSNYMKQSGIEAATSAAAMAAPAVVAAAPAGAGLGGRLLAAGLRAGATGIGTGAGALAGGATPKEAAIMGATGAVAQPVAEAATGLAGTAVKKAIQGAKGLFGESAERLATLDALPDVEEGIRSRIVQAEAQSRQNFKNAYQSLDIDSAPVNVANTKNLARQASESLNTVPGPIKHVASIPEPPSNVLTSDDPNVILKELAQFDNIPFRQAQQYRSAIEQYISKSRGSLPGNVYNQLKMVSNSLTDGLKQSAEREGKLAGFNAAEGMFKQHAADFWNRNAPLKPFLNIPSGSTGSTLSKLMNTANRVRIDMALQNRGVDTSDIRAILSQGNKTVLKDIKDAALMRQLGPDLINQQAAQANRTALMRSPEVRGALGGAFGASGAGLLYEIYRHLLGGQSQK